MLRRTLQHVLLVGVVLRVWANEPPSWTVPEFRFDPLPPEIVEAAERAGMPTAGFDAPAHRDGLRKGDSVVALVTEVNKHVTHHWLIRLATNQLSEKEKAMAPLPALRLHTSTGRMFDYGGERAALAIQVIGPFTYNPRSKKRPDKGAKDRWSGTFVNADSLGRGFDQLALAIMRLGELRQRAPNSIPDSFAFASGVEPFPVEVAEVGAGVAKQIGLGPESERAVHGASPALAQFLQIASQTPGLNDILLSVLDISWTRVFTRLGRLPEISITFIDPFVELDPAEWGLPDSMALFQVPMEVKLNGKPSLVCRMAVTTAKPPLRVSAGIIGIAAQRPDGTGPQLMIRVLASRLPEDERRPVESVPAGRSPRTGGKHEGRAFGR
jgi:hypothetical protein